MATKTKAKQAEKDHYCDADEAWCIVAGDLYLVHSTFPDGQNGITRPIHTTECRPTAEHYGRGNHFNERTTS
mgnify:CR=1 FL=1